MMRTTLSVRVSDFTMTSEMPKANAAPSTTRCPGSILSSPGRTMMTMPIRPSAIAAIRGRVSLSPRKADRQQRRPDRRRELDRDQLGQRDQRQRIEPGELPDIVRDVAADMLQRAPRAHRREAAGQIDQRQQHDEADDRAHFQDLEDVQLGGRGAAGDRHRQERRDRAGHPQRGLEVGLFMSHARYLAGGELQRATFYGGHSTGPAKLRLQSSSGSGGWALRPLPNV